MTPDQVRRLLGDHYADVAPTGAGLAALDVEALREAWSAILANDYDSSHVAIVDDAIQAFSWYLNKGETTERSQRGGS